MHPNDRPTVRKRPVLEIEPRPGAFQQRLGDEEAEPEAARFMPGRIALGALALAPAAGDIGLADPLHDLRSKAGTVVGNGDGNLLPAPGGGDLDPLVGEVDGVLEQIAEAIEDRRIAAADRFGGSGRCQRHIDRDAEVTMRRDYLLDQWGQLPAV